MKLNKFFTIFSVSGIIATATLPLCSCNANDNLNSINNSAFNKSHHKGFEIDDKIKSGDKIFQNVWMLDNIKDGERIKTIPANTFQGNKQIQHIAYVDSINSELLNISKGSFQACSSLESAWIPSTLATQTNGDAAIGERAFFRCESLNYLDFTAFGTDSSKLANLTFGKDAFTGTASAGKLGLDKDLFNTIDNEDGSWTIVSIKDEHKTNLETFGEKLLAAGLNEKWLESACIVLLKDPAPVNESDGLRYWDFETINKEAIKVEAGTETIEQMAQHLGYTSASAMIEDESKSGFVPKYISVNSLPHKLRIIGTQHDIISSGTYANKKAALTFEFANLITSGTSTVTQAWHGNYKQAYQYSESSMHYALTQKGTIGKLLPDDLWESVKTVNKDIGAVTSSEVSTLISGGINENIWIPSWKELGYSKNSSFPAEGTTYKYYSSSTKLSLRKKSPAAESVDPKSSNVTTYWLRSPRGFYLIYKAFRVDSDGDLIGTSGVDSKYGVAPCFCI